MGVLGVADADLRVVTRPHRGVAPRLGVRRAGERRAAQGEAVDQVAAQRAMAAQQGHAVAYGARVSDLPAKLPLAATQHGSEQNAGARPCVMAKGQRSANTAARHMCKAMGDSQQGSSPCVADNEMCRRSTSHQ